jgi:hypothetical protein
MKSVIPQKIMTWVQYCTPTKRGKELANQTVTCYTLVKKPDEAQLTVRYDGASLGSRRVGGLDN